LHSRNAHVYLCTRHAARRGAVLATSAVEDHGIQINFLELEISRAVYKSVLGFLCLLHRNLRVGMYSGCAGGERSRSAVFGSFPTEQPEKSAIEHTSASIRASSFRSSQANV